MIRDSRIVAYISGLLRVRVAVRLSEEPFLGGSGTMVMLSTLAGSEELPAWTDEKIIIIIVRSMQCRSLNFLVKLPV